MAPKVPADPWPGELEGLMPSEHVAEVWHVIARLSGVLPKHLTPLAWFRAVVAREAAASGLELDHWTFLVRRYATDRYTRRRIEHVVEVILRKMQEEAADLSEPVVGPYLGYAKADIRRLAPGGAQPAGSGQTRKRGSHRSPS